MVIKTSDGKPMQIIDYLNSMEWQPIGIDQEGRLREYLIPQLDAATSIWVDVELNKWQMAGQNEPQWHNLHQLVSKLMHSDDMNEIVMEEAQMVALSREIIISSSAGEHHTYSHISVPKHEAYSFAKAKEMSKAKEMFENNWNEINKYGAAWTYDDNGMECGVLLYNPCKDSVDFYRLNDGEIEFMQRMKRVSDVTDASRVLDDSEGEVEAKFPNLFHHTKYTR